MKPPSFPERLLRMLIQDERLEHGLLGDLAEEWADRSARHGERIANRWYWREALRTTPHLLSKWRPGLFTTDDAGDSAMRNGMSWLDVKLGVRMLAKYPGLTLVGGLAIAIAVAIGGAWFEFSRDYFHPTLPLPEGDRVVGVQNWNVATNAVDARSMHDFVVWRQNLRAVQELSAFRPLDRNLITADGRAEPVAGAAMSASAFRLVRVPPLLGRPLVDSDEAFDAPPVVVIGYALWQARFGGDRSIIGRTVQLGIDRGTIVGVMPEGFAFPIRQNLWVPLRVNIAEYARGQSPPIRVVGRLARGATFETAQAELNAIGTRASADFPATNEHLRPRVVPYLESILGQTPWQIELVQTFFVLILLVACANVATLVFARTATREREIAVRRALGASRSRIVAQLFAEALVLSSVAATVGLLVVWWGQGWGMDIFWGVQGGTSVRPFWWDTGLNPETVFYVGGLTVLGAAVVGVLPALKATRGQVHTLLQQSTGDGSGMRFGGVTTGVIIVQVAISVFVLPEAAGAGRQALRDRASSLGFPAEEYLSVRVEQDQTAPSIDSVATAAFLARFRDSYHALEDRIREERGVLAVTVATKLPGTDAGERPVIEVEGLTSPVSVNSSSVDAGLFAAFGMSVVAGRDFNSGDMTVGRNVVIVNQSFIHQILDGRNPIGRRVRYAGGRRAKAGPWQEIVGVVPDLAMNAFDPGKAAGLYEPLRARAYPIQLAVHVRGDAKAFAPRLREIAAAIDPSLRIYHPEPLDESARALAMGASFGASVIAMIAAVALMLSAVGIYALMSFTVSQRTREIGIRAALGADPRRIVTAILSRAIVQIGVGAVIGVLAAAFLSDQVKSDGPMLLMGVAAVMTTVGVLACFGPVRRALRIQPTEALKAGG